MDYTLMKCFDRVGKPIIRENYVGEFFMKNFYSCGLSTATIEYSSLSVCLCVCLSVCLSVCVHDNSKNNGSIHLKLEHVVVY